MAQDGAQPATAPNETKKDDNKPVDLQAAPEAVKKAETMAGLPAIPEVVDAAFLNKMKASAQESGKKKTDNAQFLLNNLELKKLLT